ncbi:hypothetical protein R50345_05915 [Paenibacillus sp. FSL R5-0345]|uniref:hypothetical protein n=1 Tax=Paenibacillus sp. FSL R5-0345 TaxID=1536770 RepID=UPI0004F7BF11|nr:hypothetical protein [Paenibacillus sp. FSL R5-0345]AIQ34204.1 hypothetical protein R50345_05915 [Paenibacillus sp. FSL R5-0345]
MAGYIGIDRGIVNHWIYKDPEYFKTWFEILYRARYSKETGTELIEGQLVEIKYGEFIFGRIKWSERIGISERRLRTLIDKLIADEMITLVKRAPKFSIYSVKNYAKYRQQNDQQETLEQYGVDIYSDQQNVQQTTSKRPASDQQVTTKEKGSNKVKKVNKESIKTYTPEFDEFWNVYPRKLGKVEAFKTWTKVIKNGESSEIIIKCATNYATDCENKQTEQQFIKHPKTFLNDERYKDYTLIAVGGGNGGEFKGRTKDVRSGGDQKKSEYAFLDVSSSRTGTAPYDPTIF